MSIEINYFWQLEFGEIRTYVDYWQILFGGLALKNRNETKNSLHMTAYSGKLPAPPYPFRDKYIPVEVAHMPPLFSVMFEFDNCEIRNVLIMRIGHRSKMQEYAR